MIKENETQAKKRKWHFQNEMEKRNAKLLSCLVITSIIALLGISLDQYLIENAENIPKIIRMLHHETTFSTAGLLFMMQSFIDIAGKYTEPPAEEKILRNNYLLYFFYAIVFINTIANDITVVEGLSSAAVVTLTVLLSKLATAPIKNNHREKRIKYADKPWDSEE